MWVRYVDDTFCVTEQQYVEKLHKHLSSILPSITFTLEWEQNHSLAFLDVIVLRNRDNTISATIYKKPTHADRYLLFDSHHPKYHKFAVTKTLRNRIDTHVTNSHDKATLHKQMQHTPTLNGFPRRFSCLAAKEKLRRPTNSLKFFTWLPYIHGTTDKIQSVSNDVGVRVAMKPFVTIVTIKKFLPTPKDPLDVNGITGFIYQVPCHDCPFVYINQTKRDLISRFSEHKRAIKYQRPEKSAFCEHSITLNHIVDWNEATILSTEKDYTKRLFAESWLINKSSNVINRKDGNTLPSVYKDYSNLQFLQLHLIVFIFRVVLLLYEYACCFLRRNIHDHVQLIITLYFQFCTVSVQVSFSA